MNFSKLLLFIYISLCSLLLGESKIQPDLETYHKQIKPILSKYCYDCHGNEKQKADIRLDNIDPNILSGDQAGMWEDVRESFNIGEMPPEKKKQPTAKEREVLSLWLDNEFKKARLVGNPNKKGSVRRLTRYELKYLLEELLHADASEAIGNIPKESISHETGLQNSSQNLMVSGPQMETYFDVIFSQTDRIKSILALKPYTAKLDIPALDLNPPVRYYQGIKSKPMKPWGPWVKGDISKKNGVLVIGPRGYVQYHIPRISKHLFKTSILARVDIAEGEKAKESKVVVRLAYRHNPQRPKQEVENIGELNIHPNDDFKEYTLKAYPEAFSEQMNKIEDKPLLIEIFNSSKNTLYLKSASFMGNITDELKGKFLQASKAQAIEKQKIDYKKLLTSFLTKAFRRFPTKAEVTKYYGVFNKHAKKEGALNALIETYCEILCSPKFFYIGTKVDIGDLKNQNFKVAERLAFFLTASGADELLIQDAAKGSLIDKQVLQSHVKRLLKDEKSRRFVENFTDQWLHMDTFLNVAVDRTYYKRFKDEMMGWMRQETIESVNDVFRNGSSALNLLKADHVFVNYRLAKWYGIKVKPGDEFRKVKIDESKIPRGGLLTQGSALVAGSDGVNSHAILRGVWLQKLILNTPPPEPPADVPDLNEENIPGFDKLTLNQKLAIHRENEACASCHARIDPYGIPFENFDASGAWREKVLTFGNATDEENIKMRAEEGQREEDEEKRKKIAKKIRNKEYMAPRYLAIERKSILPSNKSIDGIQDLKTHILNYRKGDFARGLVQKLLSYAYSRDINFYDEELLDELTDYFMKNGYSVPSLINQIVITDEFLKGAH